MAITVTNDFSTLDNCEATTGWSGSTDATAPALDNTIYKQGSNSIKLGKSGTTEPFIYYEKTFSSRSIYSDVMVVWLYIKTQAALDVINQDDCRLYFYDSSGNWAYWRVPLRDRSNYRFRDLKLGWNALRCCMGAYSNDSTGNRGDSAYVGGSSATYPDYSDLVKVRIHIAVNNASDTIAVGDLLMDYWHHGYCLQVSGGISGSEADFNDFYNHDQSNALGVVEKWNAGTYYFFIKLNISDYFYDYAGKHSGQSGQKTVIFDERMTPTAWWYYIYGNSNVAFGKVDDASKKRTVDGIHFVSLDNRYWNHLITYCKFYNCAFEAVHMYLRNSVRAWNCVGSFRLHTADGDYFNIYSNSPVEAPQPDGVFEQVKLNADYFTRPSQSAPLAVLKDCFIHGNTYVNKWYSVTASYVTVLCINLATDTWNHYYDGASSAGCNTYRMYTLYLKVVDKKGNPIQGASVKIKDKNGITVSRTDSEADLDEDLDHTETGVNVTDGAKLSEGDVIMIDGEFMDVDSIAGNTLTVTRGKHSGSGYIATYHAAGADIFIVGATTTDADGKIDEQLLTHGYWNYDNQVTEQTLGPHTIIISRSGYETYRSVFTIDEKADWEISLRRSPFVGRDAMGMAWI